MADLKAVYATVDEGAALAALDAFSGTLGQKISEDCAIVVIQLMGDKKRGKYSDQMI